MGTSMLNGTRYHEYAADCVRQAEHEQTAGDKGILLNVALAWLRLAQQTEAINESDVSAPEQAEPLRAAHDDLDLRAINHRDWAS
jgi:hypothetical protein